MIDQWLNNNMGDLRRLRRWLHQHPEIGFDEHKTSKYLQRKLIDAGYSIIQTPKMKTGFTCEYGDGEGKVLGIRCDMDALLVQEKSDKDYISVNDGVTHACGHDAHMSIVAGVALYCQEIQPRINGKIRFIFQPAEEQAPGGAIAMIDGGAIENMDHIIAGHVLPKLDGGVIGLKQGPMAATVESIEIHVDGPGGHTSRPAESVDLVWVTSHLVLSLEESIKHHLDQRDPVVLAFGKVVGGHTFNVLPTRISLTGTLRYLNTDLKDRLHKIIDDTVKGIEKMTGAKISWRVNYTSPGVFNDRGVTDLLINASKAAIGENNITILEESSMGGEDFAYYLEHIPGSYYRIGCFDGYAKDVHVPYFDIDEECIPTAIKVLSETISLYFNS